MEWLLHRIWRLLDKSTIARSIYKLEARISSPSLGRLWFRNLSELHIIQNERTPANANGTILLKVVNGNQKRQFNVSL